MIWAALSAADVNKRALHQWNKEVALGELFLLPQLMRKGEVERWCQTLTASAVKSNYCNIIYNEDYFQPCSIQC